jgi:cobalt-zinc-cadmium efflux system protein
MVHTLKQQHESQVRKLIFCIIISFSFTMIEAFVGFQTNSLALISDASHNFSDGLALIITLSASLLMKRPVSSKHTYGNYRAGILAAFFNALMLVLLSIIIFKEAWGRFFVPEKVVSTTIIITAMAAFCVNFAIGKIIFSDSKKGSLNMKAALIHVISDAVTSIAVVISGIVIYFTDFYQVDSIISIIISVSMLITGFRILLQAIDILMEAVPNHLKVDDIIKVIRSFETVKNLHDLHVWSVSNELIFLTCHIQLPKGMTLKEADAVIISIRNKLADDFNIKHSTIQIEIYKGIELYTEADVFCELKDFH